jgi:CHAT domain-containing protein/tetratricopeptide (TPR) repeat protein
MLAGPARAQDRESYEIFGLTITAHGLNEDGRYAEALPLAERAVALARKRSPESDSLGWAASVLAETYRAQGRYAEAESLLKRSIAIIEKLAGRIDVAVAHRLGQLANLYHDQGRYTDAEPLYRQALTITKKVRGPSDSDVGTALSNLASAYLGQGRYAEAEPLYRQALAITDKALGRGQQRVGSALDNLAALHWDQRNWAKAADYWRRSISIIKGEAAEDIAFDRIWRPKRGRAQQLEWQFWALVRATHRTTSPSPTPAHVAEMFETAQWALSPQAADSLMQMAARSTKGSPKLSELVRERQDLVQEYNVNQKLEVAAMGEEPAKRKATHGTFDSRRSTILSRLKVNDRQLKQKFPEYAALVSRTAVSIADVQAQLRTNEAFVFFLDTPEWRGVPEESFVWVVTRSEVRWLRSDLGTAALRREVAALRCGLDAAAWRGKGALRCADLLKLPPQKAPEVDQPLPFDAARAHALYASLLGGARDLIDGKHLLVVPSGALTTLPFQVLVTEAPSSSDLAKVRWLVRDHAITVLPSAASLVALRRTGRPSAAPKPMLGFANPLLDGDPENAEDKQEAQRARDHTGCAPTRTESAARRAIRRSATPVPQTEGLADLAQLRMQEPLPETADEVCDVARSIGADVLDMRTGVRATETEIKRLSAAGDLARYRILHFATHGILAGKLSGTSEPGLILTPPATATQQDDGYLSGSEIATLKLDADWVILSACNTAGGSGDTAEALSGMARAFFYAGARALLVSHWEVDSQAAVKLTTRAFDALRSSPTLSRAEAFRISMRELAEKATPADGHPSRWAPFVVVGDGTAIVQAASDSAGPRPPRSTSPGPELTAPPRKPAAPAGDWRTDVWRQ